MFKHIPRLLLLWKIAASYRLDKVLKKIIEKTPNVPAKVGLLILLIKLHPAAWFKKEKPQALKLALENMGTLFLKLGQLLSTRSDLVPPEVIQELALLQDKVTPFSSELAKQFLQADLDKPMAEIFARFDDKPLAAASIAQVHTASFHDGREVVVKIVRPELKQQILADFALLKDLSTWLEARFEPARALHIIEIVEDYRQIMLDELDLRLEAHNTQKMRNNFLGSDMMYVPEVYFSSERILVAERIHGVPISDLQTFDKLGIDRAQLAEKGLTIFFTQLFRDNFFHADMHPGNVFVETINKENPRYIALDCAIVGELSDQDRLIVARLLLSVMQNNFTQMVQVVHQAGWIPPSTDQHVLARDMKRTVGPMISKPIDEIDFANVMVEVMEIARRHRLDIPPQLMLLIKTLIHVEGLGRNLYPALDIWSLTKPILTEWITKQVNPSNQLKTFRKQLPDMLVGATDLPNLFMEGLTNLRRQEYWNDQQLREMKSLKNQLANERRSDWMTFSVVLAGVFLSLKLSLVGSIICFMVIILFVFFRMQRL